MKKDGEEEDKKEQELLMKQNPEKLLTDPRWGGETGFLMFTGGAGVQPWGRALTCVSQPWKLGGWSHHSCYQHFRSPSLCARY